MSTAQFAAMTTQQARDFMGGAKAQPARRRLMELVAGRDVIDIGCGKGEQVGLYAPERYTGVDCSPELIAIARERWPGYQFEVAAAQDIKGHWPVAIMKAVLEHVPPDEAVAIYEAARSCCDVLYLAWHWEPGIQKLTTYEAGGMTWQQNRHDRGRFTGMVDREVCGPHVIWTVR